MDYIAYGYYDHHNLGDEAFKLGFSKMFQNIKFTYKIDDTKNYKNVIVGGGDVINEYFYNNYKKIDKNKFTIALSVSIPDTTVIPLGYIDNFDHIFLRSKQDLKICQDRLGSEFVHYLPDLVFNIDPPVNTRTPKTLGIFPTSYTDPNQIINIIRDYPDHTITIYRFDTSEKQSDDINVLYKVHNLLYKVPDVKVNIDTLEYTPLEMLEIISKLEFAICYRFHSHIFCTLTSTPFISYADTKKSLDFLKDSDLLYLHYPKDKINFTELKDKLTQITKQNKILLNTDKIINLFSNNKKRINNHKNLDQICIEVDNIIKLHNYDRIKDAETIAQIMSSKITNNNNSPYVHGTIENLKKGIPLREMLKYMLKDFKEIIYDTTPNILNLNYINQYVGSNIHRAGWNYVIKNLNYYNSSKGILVDTYVDRTFHWNCESFRAQGIIPYTNYWVGFIHHTDLEDYSNYNIQNLFSNKIFIQSLYYCKCLFVLSDRLKRTVEKYTNVPVMTIYHPTEFTPNLFNFKKFNNTVVHVGAWMRNTLEFYLFKTQFDKLILKGKFMDNYFPEGKIYFTTKSSREEKRSTNVICRTEGQIFLRFIKEYIISNNYFINSEHHNFTLEDVPKELHCTYTKPEKIYTTEYTKFLKRKINSLLNVQIKNYVNDDDYDDILSCSVVYINLLDASAVNTLIECVVRNTPIVINKLPAVVEILGDSYPLYLNTFKKLNTYKVLLAHEYLKKLNKDKLKIENFLNSFIERIKLIT